jgi:hypothetical protein
MLRQALPQTIFGLFSRNYGLDRVQRIRRGIKFKLARIIDSVGTLMNDNSVFYLIGPDCKGPAGLDLMPVITGSAADAGVR